MRTLLLSLVLNAMVLAAPPATFTGVIVDAECARGGHTAMRMGPTDAECAKACVLSHDAAYVLDDGTSVYALSDQKLAERFAAQEVKVVGTLSPDSKTIHVESIAAGKYAQ